MIDQLKKLASAMGRVAYLATLPITEVVSNSEWQEALNDLDAALAPWRNLLPSHAEMEQLRKANEYLRKDNERMKIELEAKRAMIRTSVRHEGKSMVIKLALDACRAAGFTVEEHDGYAVVKP